ncbi:MAG: cobalamin-dependent protein [Candidatus Omnitrophica bacterium]|nr:cobalamin-dependent protein [Candidatus Omnitrophota bacterium]
MRVLLINPPVRDFFFTPQRAYPLGLLSLATVLEQSGVAVRILNMPAGGKATTAGLPDDFRHLQRYYQENKSAFRLFSHYRHFGLPESSVDEHLRQFQPDMVGIAANFAAYLRETLAIAQRVKHCDARIPVVAGGRLATVLPETLLASSAIDFVLRGEAEYSLRDLCRVVAGKGSAERVAGLCDRRQGAQSRISRSIARIDDLNNLPILNRGLIDCEEYNFQGMRSAALLASRGCSLGCSFCAIRERFRFRRAAHVLAEIEDCYRRGIRHFNFEDDNMNLNPEFAALLSGIRERYSGTIRISFMNGLLSRGITAALRRLLLDAGLTHLDLSVGTVNSRMRAAVCRREQPRNVYRLAREFSSAGITTTVHFILAMPGQSRAMACAELRRLAAQPVLLGPSIFYPVPESPLFRKIRPFFPQWQEQLPLFRSSVAVYEREIARDDIMTLFALSRLINFLKVSVGSEAGRDVHLRDYLARTLSAFAAAGNSMASVSSTNFEVLSLRLVYYAAVYGRLYRLLKQGGDSPGYVAVPEVFAAPTLVRRVLNRLIIRAPSGATLRLGVPGDYAQDPAEKDAVQSGRRVFLAARSG